MMYAEKSTRVNVATLGSDVPQRPQVEDALAMLGEQTQRLLEICGELQVRLLPVLRDGQKTNLAPDSMPMPGYTAPVATAIAKHTNAVITAVDVLRSLNGQLEI